MNKSKYSGKNIYGNIKILGELRKTDNYPVEEYKFLAKIEPIHFWFIGRNKIIRSVINNTLKFINKKTSFLEIGCGSGFVLSELQRTGMNLTGIDVNIEGLKLARTRTKAELICGDFLKNNFNDKYDAIGIFDVLEHIKNEEQFIKKCFKSLNSDGYLYIAVPADMKLWSVLDEISGHYRRYNKKGLQKLFIKCGFEVVFVNYFGFFQFMPQLVIRKIQEIKARNYKINTEDILKEALTLPPFFFNFVFKLFLILESKIINIASFPFGASIILVAKKKTNS